MNIHNSMHGDFSSWSYDLVATPCLVDELLPELRKQPLPAVQESTSDAIPMPRGLFGLVALNDASDCVLAVLGPKSGLTSRTALAKLCGYKSELEFFAESEPLASTDPRRWFTTLDRRSGGWVLWCADKPAPADQFDG